MTSPFLVIRVVDEREYKLVLKFLRKYVDCWSSGAYLNDIYRSSFMDDSDTDGYVIIRRSMGLTVITFETQPEFINYPKSLIIDCEKILKHPKSMKDVGVHEITVKV